MTKTDYPDFQGMWETFTNAEMYGEQVDTKPIHTAKEELRKELIDTIERYTLDEYKCVVMDAVRKLLELKK